MSAPVRMLPHDMQLSNEMRYSRKHIDKYIDKEIRENPEMEAKVMDGIRRLEDWLAGTYYESKQARIDQIRNLEVEAIVRKTFILAAYCQIPELFTSISAQLAGALKMDSRRDAITTMAEILAVLCLTDAYDILRLTDNAQFVVKSNIPLSEKLLVYVSNSRYLPPMVCEPADLTSNFESAYLTHNDCVILGSNNAHSEDVCLDTINTLNKVPFSLKVDFLKTVEEMPSEKQAAGLSDPAKRIQWDRFKEQSYELYRLMYKQGNRFWFTWKVDKRGRLYCQGYHLSIQGSSFKKGMLELADKEIVEGVPNL